MVNSGNRIDGRSITEHPLPDAKPYLLQGELPHLAAQAPIGGIVDTMGGDRRFQAGDWIVSDVPVTHAWPVQDQTFRHDFVPVSAAETVAERPVVAKKPVVRRKKPVRRVTKPKPVVIGEKGPERIVKVADSESLKALT